MTQSQRIHEFVSMRRKLALASFLGLGALCTGGAHAQQPTATFPSRPVRIVVPASPGGAIDAIARLLAERLTSAWGQAVVVENRAGGSQMIGTDVVAKAPPDGHSIVIVASSHALNPYMFKRMPYDSIKDFSFITQTHQVPLMLAVSSASPFKTVQELTDYARAHPGKLSYASSGQGSSLQVAAELYKAMGGIDLLHVPYKGSTAAHPDVLAGRTTMIFDTVPAIFPHVKSGLARGLAVTTGKRLSIAPDMPTLSETVMPGFESSSWGGLLAPAGTPGEIVAQLNSAIVKILTSPDVAGRLAGQGIELVTSSPQQWEAFMQDELRKAAAFAKAARIVPE